MAGLDHFRSGCVHDHGRFGGLLLRQQGLGIEEGHAEAFPTSEESMSRVHDALRRAEQAGLLSPPVARGPVNGETRAAAATLDPGPNLAGLLERVEEIPFRTATDSLLIDVTRPHEAP